MNSEISYQAALARRALVDSQTVDGLDAAMRLLDEVDGMLSTLTVSTIGADTAERVRRVRDNVGGFVLAARPCAAAGASPTAVAQLLRRAADEIEVLQLLRPNLRPECRS